jgi:hypothetical protein
MKTKTLLAIFLCISGALRSQIIENFTDWTPSGKEAPFDWEAPTNWSTTNPLYEFINSGIKRTSEGVSLKTLNVFGEQKISSIVLGYADVSYLQNTLNPEGVELDNKLQRVIIDYVFESTSASDAGSMKLRILDSNNNQKLEVDQILQLETNQIIIDDFAYNHALGDRLIMAFFSSDINSPMAGGNLRLHKVTYDIASHVNENDLVSNFNIYPNPVLKGNGIIHIEQNQNEITQYHLMNLEGGNILIGTFNNKRETLNLPSTIAPGVYILRLRIKEQNIDKRIVVID